MTPIMAFIGKLASSPSQSSALATQTCPFPLAAQCQRVLVTIYNGLFIGCVYTVMAAIHLFYGAQRDKS